MATQQTRLESLAAAVGGAVKANRNRLPPMAGTAGLPLVKTNSAADGVYAPAKLDLAAINAPANSDGLYLKVSGGVLVAAAAPAGGGSGTTYTAGDGIAISGSTIAIDPAKVARKDVGQTFAGDQNFTGIVRIDYLRSNSGEGALDLYGGYLTMQSEYGIQIGNGNAQVNFFDSVNFNTDVFYGGEHLTSVFAPRYAFYENRTASFTLAGYMVGATVRLTSSSTSTITIPANGSDYFPIGAVCTIQRGGTGAVIFSPASGVTLEAAGGILSIPERYGLVDLVKTDTNAWTMVASVPFNSPAFTGTPTAPTAASSDSSTTIATTAFVKVALATTLVPREITYEMFHPNHGGIAQFYHAPVAESVRVSPIYGNIGYSIAAAFGTGAPSWSAVTYLNAGSQATVSIPAGGTMRLELSGDAQGIPRWCHVKRLSGGS